MLLSDLTSNARWKVRRYWDRGVPTVLARKARHGFSVRPFHRPDHYSHLLAEGWQVVEEVSYESEANV